MRRGRSCIVACGLVMQVVCVILCGSADASYELGQHGNETRQGARRFLQSCDRVQLQERMQEVEVVCCDELEEECSTGFPTRCNPGCSAVFLPVRCRWCVLPQLLC